MTETMNTMTTISPNGSNTSISTLKYYDFFNPGTPFDRAMDALLILAVIMSFYLLTSFLIYEWRIRRNTNPKKLSIGLRKSRAKIGDWLRILCILSALFCLLRCVNDIAYYKAQAMSDVPCTVLKNLGASWLIYVDTTVYLFLWLRHRALYQNKSLRLPSNIAIKITSWIAVVLIAGLFLSMNVVILGFRRYIYDPVKAKCRSTDKMASEVNYKLFLAGSSTLHIVLVFLYVYPLIRQVIRMKMPRKHETKAPTSTEKPRQPQQSPSKEGKKGLMYVAVKCVILSLVCVATDTLTIILAETRVINATKARHFSYNLNVLINTVAIVLSLTDWRHMLFPFYGLLVQKPTKKEVPTMITTNLEKTNPHRVVT